MGKVLNLGPDTQGSHLAKAKQVWDRPVSDIQTLLGTQDYTHVNLVMLLQANNNNNKNLIIVEAGHIVRFWTELEKSWPQKLLDQLKRSV